jgi:hypothetical protein
MPTIFSVGSYSSRLLQSSEGDTYAWPATPDGAGRRDARVADFSLIGLYGATTEYTASRLRCPFLAFGVATLAGWSCSNVVAADRMAPTLPAAKVAETRAVLEHQVSIFVHGVTRNPGFSEDEPLVRWNTPICFYLGGLTAEQVKFVLARLSQTSSSAGAPLARAPCQPNFVILATSEPERVLKASYARNPQLFGTATPAHIRQFLESSQSRPVRVWYNINLGRRSGVHNGHFVPSSNQAESSPFVGNTAFDFYSIVVIIDTNRTEHTRLDQLADYLVMAGLTNVDLDSDLGSAPSILRLFASSGENQPSGLSGWDAAFLKALYQSNQTSRTQRSEITERVAHGISALMSAESELH